VLSYFMMDDSLLIFEPPIRNSGIVGGKFLERQRVYKPESEEIYTFQVRPMQHPLLLMVPVVAAGGLLLPELPCFTVCLLRAAFAPHLLLLLLSRRLWACTVGPVCGLQADRLQAHV
jgi:hypothetical protein